jgi:hypothetical protein
MAITSAALRNAIKLELYGSAVTERPFQCALDGAILVGATTLDVPDGTAWVAGDVGEFEDGDQFLVTGVATNTLTVIRSYLGTTAAGHSDQDIISKNPRFSVAQIDQAVEHVVQDLRPDVYLLEIKELTYSSTTDWYPFDQAGDTEIYDVRSVYIEPSSEDYPQGVYNWKYMNPVDSTEFAAAQGLLFPLSWGIASGDSVFCAVRKYITGVSDLPDEVKSLVIMGACYQLLGAANTHRIHDPGKRTDRTVQPGAASRDSIWYLREYKRRYDKYAALLETREARLPQNRMANRARRYRP